MGDRGEAELLNALYIKRKPTSGQDLVRVHVLAEESNRNRLEISCGVRE